MEHGFYLAVRSTCEGVVESAGVHIVGDAQAGEIAKLVALLKVIDGNDVVNAACVRPLMMLLPIKPAAPVTTMRVMA